jgi:hypothetical protein
VESVTSQSGRSGSFPCFLIPGRACSRLPLPAESGREAIQTIGRKIALGGGSDSEFGVLQICPQAGEGRHVV